MERADVLAAMDAEATYLETIGNPRGEQVRAELERLLADEPVTVEPEPIESTTTDPEKEPPVVEPKPDTKPKPEKAVKPPAKQATKPEPEKAVKPPTETS